MPRTSKHRRRRRPRRVGWFRGLAGELLNACLSIEHRWYGSDLAGQRVIKIERAKVDRVRRQVVEIVARLCGGDGWKGPRVTLTDRREFVGGACNGIVRGRETIPVDAFYAAALARRRPPSPPAAMGDRRAGGQGS